MTRQIAFDTETTGRSAANGDRIVEIGCVEIVERKRTGGHLQFYLDPERDSEEGALRVHGLTRAFLSDKPKFAEIADEFLAYIQGAQLIIHNAAFDVGFVDMELERLGKPPLHTWVAGIVDTVVLSKEAFPGKLHTLDALCSRLGVDNSGRSLHGALLDAELLADAYLNLTRRQDGLLMAEEGQGESRAGGQEFSPPLDFTGLNLPVLRANAQELAAHEEILAQLDKASGHQTVWRKYENAGNAEKTVQ